MIDAEIAIAAGNRDVGLIEISDGGEARAGKQIVLELTDRVAISLGNNFDAAIGQVADGAEDLVARGGTQGEEAIANALNRPGDDESTRNHSPDDTDLPPQRATRYGTG